MYVGWNIISDLIAWMTRLTYVVRWCNGREVIVAWQEASAAERSVYCISQIRKLWLLSFSLVKRNSNVLAPPTVLHVSHFIVEINHNFSLLSPCFILSASIWCICRASLLLGHTSSVSVGFLLVSYHLGKASQPCKLILSLVLTADMGVYKLSMSIFLYPSYQCFTASYFVWRH